MVWYGMAWFGLVFGMPFFFGVRMALANTYPFVLLRRERIVLPLA